VGESRPLKIHFSTLAQANNRQEGGLTMIEKYMEAMAQNRGIVFFRLLGIALVIAGIITAALRVTLAGFTPVLWVLLGICSFLGVICHTLYRIVMSLERKVQD
jgi:hypothetical protein